MPGLLRSNDNDTDVVLSDFETNVGAGGDAITKPTPNKVALLYVGLHCGALGRTANTSESELLGQDSTHGSLQSTQIALYEPHEFTVHVAPSHESECSAADAVKYFLINFVAIGASVHVRSTVANVLGLMATNVIEDTAYVASLIE